MRAIDRAVVWGMALAVSCAATVYLPVVFPRPRPPWATPACDYRSDPRTCWYATLTAEAVASSTSTRTPRPWMSPTPWPWWRGPGGLILAQGVGARVSVKIEGGGRLVGHCAPMSDGCYTAAHVVRAGGGYTVSGMAAPLSIDRDRDLAHIAAMSDRSVALRPAAPGEILAWQNSRSGGQWRVVEVDGGTITVCMEAGQVSYGDSGTGGYSEVDGRLVGILTNADVSAGWPLSPACDGAQQARLEAVP